MRVLTAAAIVIWGVLPLYAATPMIDKHIFSPQVQVESPTTEKKLSPLTKKLSKELDFTGIIVKGDDRFVMIRDKKNKDSRRLFRQGEKIRTMIIDKVGSNYVLLTDKDKKVRINLYQGKKNRPAPPPLPAQKTLSAPGETAVKPAAGSVPKPGSPQSIANALTGAKRKAAEKNSANGKNKAVNNLNKYPDSNAFIEMMEKSQKSIQANPEAHKKFMELFNKAKSN